MVFLTEAPRDVNASSIASVKYSSNFCAKILSGCESFTLSASVFWVFWESEIPASIKTGSLIEVAGVDNESLMFFWFEKFYSSGHFFPCVYLLNSFAVLRVYNMSFFGHILSIMYR